MAKAKAKPKTKPPTPKPTATDSDSRQPALQQSLAILAGLVAVFIIVGGFGLGGRAPVLMFDGLSWLIGWSTWIIAPAIATYLIWSRFRHKNEAISPTKMMALISTFLAFNGLLHLFADQQLVAQVAGEGRYGGQIGYLVSQGCQEFLSRNTSLALLLTLTIINLLFVLGITPRYFFDWLAKHFRRPPSVSTNQKVASPKTTDDSPSPKTETGDFKLNEGVPVETSSSKKRAPKNKDKKAADELDTSPGGDALTVDTDSDWEFPPLSLLSQKQTKADAGDVQSNAEIIRETLANFSIDVEMEGANIGPRVTQYTLKPPSGIKLTKITGLESNIALDLAAQSIRIEAPIPGQRAVGIEVPNRRSATVLIHDLLTSDEWNQATPGSMTFVLGKDITGRPVLSQLEKMPHLLIAGQTGAGKSVAINTLITSLLYRCSPARLKLIMVDPKQVELAPYNDIPHLLTPVITEPEKCISALKWAVAEMERRLRTFAGVGKRNIGEFNDLDDTQSMPFVVIIIDELADLMMMAARDVEALIVRIAQKARAAGIHLVLATQRPSVNVITGLIKANIPGRVAFTVASQIDSRTIIDQAGAEKLLGMGDMLYLNASLPKPKRIQGALITDNETLKICQFLKKQRPVEYDGEVVSQAVSLSGGSSSDTDDIEDDLWEAALEAVVAAGKASTSLLQRRLRIGYARAARIIEAMEDKSIVAPADGSRPREVLIGSVDEGLNSKTPSTDDANGETETNNEPETELETPKDLDDDSDQTDQEDKQTTDQS